MLYIVVLCDKLDKDETKPTPKATAHVPFFKVLIVAPSIFSQVFYCTS